MRDKITAKLQNKYNSEKVTVSTIKEQKNYNKPGHAAFFVTGYVKSNGKVNHISELVYIAK